MEDGKSATVLDEDAALLSLLVVTGVDDPFALARVVANEGDIGDWNSPKDGKMLLFNCALFV